MCCCVYVCYMCVTCSRVSIPGGQKRTSSGLLYRSLPHSCDTAFSLILKPGWWSASHHDSPISTSSQCVCVWGGLQVHLTTHSFSDGFWGFELRSLCLYSKHSWPLSHLPRPPVTFYLKKQKNLLTFNLFAYCVCGAPQHTCRDERIVYRNLFSPSTLWVPRIKLRCSRLGYIYLLSHPMSFSK